MSTCRKSVAPLGVRAIVTGRVAQRGDNSSRVELVDIRIAHRCGASSTPARQRNSCRCRRIFPDNVADKLRQRLSSGETSPPDRRETVNPEAYEVALQGRLYRKGGNENTRRALEYFQRAIALDPNYAFAHVLLANTYTALVFNSGSTQGIQAESRSDGAKSIELDETLADAHVALGTFARRCGLTGAQREYERAVALNPSLAAAHRQ